MLNIIKLPRTYNIGLRSTIQSCNKDVRVVSLVCILSLIVHMNTTGNGIYMINKHT